MKPHPVLSRSGYFPRLFTPLLLLAGLNGLAQSCPTSGVSTINSYPTTYYPAGQLTVAAGSHSITLGPVTYGSAPINAGDIVLIIQMQGAQINSNNNNSYGDGSGSGSGYLANGAMYAGLMEYAVATCNVPLAGGTLTIGTGTVNNYSSNVYGVAGQRYSYQVIRVPVYYDLQLTGRITVPAWDGMEGGVLVLYAGHNLDLNGQTIDASGLGFRGGGGRALTGYGSGSSADYVTPSTNTVNGSKGEGLAGTPIYLNPNNTTLYTGSLEGYTNGSYGQGAPGNAGGGGTDGNAAANDQNTGGGGGGNGGPGGVGGYAWSSGIASGGRGGDGFAQVSPSRLVMGGGGGAGTTNNATGTPGSGFASSGAAGGGIIILTAANAIIGTGTLLANGGDANSTVQNDGAGGGGAGGSILIYSNNGNMSNITARANGGTGGTNQMGGGAAHGPGGGGGGGIIYSKASLNAASSVNGGAAGTTSGQSTNYGATVGSAGILVMNISRTAMPTFPLNCTVLGLSLPEMGSSPENDATALNGSAAKFSLYPNPAQTVATISFVAPAEALVTLRVFDLGGKDLWLRQYAAHRGANAVQLDCIQTLPDGIYLLQWFDRLQSQQVKFMVHH
ncbi:MAG TPA: T9SS type A sorting domain-containing protein [Puia sp.]|nr:T9SS type A sorting domain-containing protein [Puia sp.]